MSDQTGDRIVRIDEVCRTLGLSKSTVWRRIRQGEFPPPFLLGGQRARAVGWRESVVLAWLDDHESARREPPETISGG